tara:strand:+ start:9606 stop:9980 length:375 start_codon:yes stop_codon:yes gene_type:complete
MSDEQEIYATLIEIREEPTALYKILKIANLVSGGGEAKQAISEGYVSLNGAVETQKRKKIYAGDLIYFNEQYLQIAIIGETEGYELVESTPDETSSFESKLAQAKAGDKDTPKKKPMKRKPISF